MDNLKYQFFNDYSETAHPACLHAVLTNPTQQEAGYGQDTVSEQARALIRAQIANEAAEVHFFSGGTQANLTVISAALRSHEAVIAAQSGHIAANETGAIEATGHKVIAVSHKNGTPDGKLTPEALEETLRWHRVEIVVKPRMVFISQASELGTVYSRAELRALRALCDAHDLYLYIDGARLGMALAAEGSDIDMAFIAGVADVFYIGGTKNGALLGEAVVIINPDLQKEFRYVMKQRGALLAKGRVMASQFVALFENDGHGQNLYLHNARHANACAQRLAQGLRDIGVAFASDSPTNQIFPILDNAVMTALQKNYGFYHWSPHDDTHSVARFVTSWATPMTAVEEFLTDARRLLG